MKRPAESPFISFLYRTRAGHALLSAALILHADRLFAAFLHTGASRSIIPWYIRKHRIDMSACTIWQFHSFRDFFLRDKEAYDTDTDPAHLISPCDGHLSAYRIREDAAFLIKGTRYTVRDLTGEDAPADYAGGACLIFRLSASDIHHYGYIDDGSQGVHHYIEGTLHSVQEAALRAYPVFARNRRTWSVLDSAHFGRIIQIEVGAFAVGGIVNHRQEGYVRRGEEKGYFDLAGSSIVLLFEKDRIRLRSSFASALLRGEEVAVKRGQKIGTRCIAPRSDITCR